MLYGNIKKVFIFFLGQTTYRLIKVFLNYRLVKVFFNVDLLKSLGEKTVHTSTSDGVRSLPFTTFSQITY